MGYRFNETGVWYTKYYDKPLNIALGEQRGELLNPDRRSGKTSWYTGVRKRLEWRRNFAGRGCREGGGQSTVLLRVRRDLSFL